MPGYYRAVPSGQKPSPIEVIRIILALMGSAVRLTPAKDGPENGLPSSCRIGSANDGEERNLTLPWNQRRISRLFLLPELSQAGIPVWRCPGTPAPFVVVMKINTQEK